MNFKKSIKRSRACPNLPGHEFIFWPANLHILSGDKQNSNNVKHRLSEVIQNLLIQNQTNKQKVIEVIVEPLPISVHVRCVKLWLVYAAYSLRSKNLFCVLPTNHQQNRQEFLRKISCYAQMCRAHQEISPKKMSLFHSKFQSKWPFFTTAYISNIKFLLHRLIRLASASANNITATLLSAVRNQVIPLFCHTPPNQQSDLSLSNTSFLLS